MSTEHDGMIDMEFDATRVERTAGADLGTATAAVMGSIDELLTVLVLMESVGTVAVSVDEVELELVVLVLEIGASVMETVEISASSMETVDILASLMLALAGGSLVLGVERRLSSWEVRFTAGGSTEAELEVEVGLLEASELVDMLHTSATIWVVELVEEVVELMEGWLCWSLASNSRASSILLVRSTAACLLSNFCD